jgi:hypothetical protein
MWADARLQRANARLRLGLHIALPLLRDVEVPQHQPAGDRADEQVDRLKL